MSVDLGAAIYIAIKPILKIYCIIFVGYLLARFKIVTTEIARGISNMVVNAILPCLTFNKIVSNISWRDIKEIGVILLSAVILFSVGTVCSLITNFATKAPKQWFWGLIFAGLFPNISDLPIAYVQSMGNGTIFTAAEADKGVAYSCIFLTAQSFLLMNFGLWRLVGLDFKNAKKNDTESTVEDSSTSSEAEHKFVPSTQVPIQSKSKNNDYLGENHMEHTYEEMQSIRSLPNTESLTRSINSTSTDPEEYSVRSLNPDNFIRNSTSLDAYKVFSAASSPAFLERSIENPLENNLEESTEGNTDLRRRRRKSSVNNVIEEYSEVTRIKTGELDLSKPLTLLEDIGTHNVTITKTSEGNTSVSDGMEENYTNDSNSENAPHSIRAKFNKFMTDHKLEWLVYIGINFFRPASLGALLGIICALIPWVKALFVPTYVHVHMAPDGEPVLNFLMDFTAYIGNACIPLGLLMLGGTLARLEINTLPEGFLKTAVAMTVFRLMVLPIIGVAWANKLMDINWMATAIGKFVMILTWSMPSATAQVYFTAFYTPLEGDHTQMDCLSVFFLMQYTVLFITLSFVVTYTLKVDLKV
ncbi:hypothetical protein Kpol_397p6 [Vanderwaltozyma polyspora DSM 70294]|uniref:Protein ECM3 n=1 Tax=Vanderwaltozyma polyspora (strain ATCC 22028 / DSM 70294 / BCRC 21397 / CBS 2163 / NBRC 10782 / NRRL Y-8283 / UCD 57-17) TaxID=436907 RepID=A7TRF8_VANPO|nr:uncharacterized protein Kpol_397p6 [Vanderwaltozyma polyspora DSM 70294]EDO15147.1 hypothetical protein Kpol_397p6 [Vanderwaltozyma polyspora DSM 70294]